MVMEGGRWTRAKAMFRYEEVGLDWTM